MFRKTKHIITNTAQDFHQSPFSTASGSQNNEENAESSSRPRIQVEPRGIGPVIHLHENDVLCGRGGRINGHYGNIQFRKFCSEKREEYFAKGIKKVQKAHIAASVVDRIRNMSPPGRFLKQDGKTGQWYDIGCQKAMTKVGQAIREHTPKTEEIEEGERVPGEMSKRGSTLLAFNGPLYPGCDDSENDREPQYDQVAPSSTAKTMINASFLAAENINQPTIQPTTSGCVSNHHGASTCNSNQYENKFLMNPQQRQQKRLSALSMMSGMSRMSALMRASLQSGDWSSDIEGTIMSSTAAIPSSRRTSAADSLLRQSVLSDISDCMSVMSLQHQQQEEDCNNHGRPYYGNAGCLGSSEGVAQSECLGMMMQQDSGMNVGLADTDMNTPVPYHPQHHDNHSMSRMEFPTSLGNDRMSMISGNNADTNVWKEKPQQQVLQQERFGRRHSRKSSLWSLSMTSTISLLSIGSATSMISLA